MLPLLFAVATAAPVTDGPAWIVQGRPEAGFPSAVALGIDAVGQRQATCSASLITPKLLLTAAHCTEEFNVPDELILQVGAAFFGPEVGQSSRTVRFANVTPHPAYEARSGPAGLPNHDIEVIELRREITEVAPVWIRTTPLTRADLDTATLTSVGYGISDAEAQSGAGLRRSTRLTASLGNRQLGVSDRFLVSVSSENPRGANVCSGDSGGPMYATLPDGRLEQWAIHSWADEDCAYVSGSWRVDVDLDFVLGEVERVHGADYVCAVALAGNGVCDDGCGEVDPDCVDAGGPTGPSTPGGDTEDDPEGVEVLRVGRGCDHTQHPALALALLALVARRRTA